MSKHVIQISEPWDFELEDGTNEFMVSGIGVVQGPELENWGSEYLLVAVDNPFVMEGEEVNQLICSTRYVGEKLAMVLYSECNVGIARVKPGFSMKAGEQVDPQKVDYCAIGSIKIDT